MAGKSTSSSVARLNHIPVQTSVYGTPITIGWGTFRCSPNVVWQGTLKSTAIKQSTGGKGGKTTTGYNYYASTIMGICQGAIVGIKEAFKDSNHYVDGDLYTRYNSIASALTAAGNSAMAADYTALATMYQKINTSATTAMQSVGLSVTVGNIGQAAKGFLTGDEAIGYSGLAYAYAQDYALSTSATLPNHTFVVSSNTRMTVGSVTLDDAHPADVITDFFTNTYYKLPSWQSGLLGDLTEYRAACTAYGFFLSPCLDSQSTASSFLQEIIEASNAEAYFSEGVLKIRPYADVAKTANGATFTPNLTPVYSFTDSDYVVSDGEEPIRLELKSPADAYNYVQIEYTDRTHAYNSSIAPAYDQASIDQFGLRKQDPITYRAINLPSVATSVAQVKLQQTCNVRATYHFTVPEQYCLIEPMDLVEVTDVVLGLVNQLVRVKEVTENDDGTLTLSCVEMLVGASSAPLITRQSPVAAQTDFNVAPPNVSNPVLINPPRSITTAGQNEAWIAVAGSNENWGGCEVWASFDNVNYSKYTSIDSPSRYGSLTASLPSAADPDNTNTLAVDLTASLGSLTSASSTASGAGATLCLIDGELISYTTATLTDTFKYNLTGLRRGQNSTSPAAHSSGARFIRLDDNIVKYPYNASQVGKTLYLKFLSFNPYGLNTQELSDVSPYSITLNPGSAPTIDIVATSSADGSAAVSAINAINDSSILTKDKKPQVIQDWNTVQTEYTTSNWVSTASGLGITTEVTAYQNAYIALTNYLNSLTVAGGASTNWYDYTTNTAINRTNWNNAWQGYDTTKLALQAKINAAQKVNNDNVTLSNSSKGLENLNAGFDVYTNATGLPDTGWNNWNTPNATRISDGTGGYACRINGSASAGVGQGIYFAQACRTNAYIVKYIKYILRAGTNQGGMLYDPNGGHIYFANTPDAYGNIAGNGVVGQTYVFSKIVKAVSGQADIIIFASSDSWALASAGANNANTLDIYECGWRYATDSEIKTQTIEVGADVTLNAQITPSGATSTIIDFLGGVPVSGQLPRTVQARAFKGGTEITSGGTWAISNAQNCTVTVSNASGSNGLESISALSGTGNVERSYVRNLTYNGVLAFQQKVTIGYNNTDSVAVQSKAGVPRLFGNNVNSSSWASMSTNGVMSIANCPANGVINLGGGITFSDPIGGTSGDCVVRVRLMVDGSAVYTSDAKTVIISGSPVSADFSDVYKYINSTLLGAGTHTFNIEAQRVSGTATAMSGGSLSVTVTGT